MKYLLSVFIILGSIGGINAQIKLQTFLDVGENNASEGVFIKNVYRGSYSYEKYSIDAGLQFDLYGSNPNVLTGFDITGSRAFSIKKFPFNVRGFFILNRFSDLLYDTNWGLKINTIKMQHFLIEVGTNFKSYAINAEAREKYNIDKSRSKLRENFNLIYTISVYVKPHDNDWNIGLSITNVDYYIINQSTNPVINLQTKYKPKSNLTMFLDSWYKQAGILNIYANYFGYFFRGGIIWEFSNIK